MKKLCLAILCTGFVGLAGCAADPNADVDRNTVSNAPTTNMNSPTAGPTSSGLSGGNEASNPSELDPDRGTKIQDIPR